MRELIKKTDNKFLNIFEVFDPENHCKGYQFAERRGIDSIAFICYDKSQLKLLLNHEFTPPNGEFMYRAFGGSLDKSNKSREEIVIEEVLEEAGFNVTLEDVKEVGKCFVSTQMNQYCYLYLVFVDNSKKTERRPENLIESLAQPAWVSEQQIIDGDDWKAITIISKAIYLGILKPIESM